MNFLIYWVGRAFIAFIQMLPLPWVARLGRAIGALTYALDARHRRVVFQNLTMCFGREKTAAELTGIARENFRRIAENYLSSIKTASMTPAQLKPYFEFVGAEKILPRAPGEVLQSRVVALGHFGNFELYARFGEFIPVFECCTTYRALKQPALNRLMLEVRKRADCYFFERRLDGAALKTAIHEQKLLVGLLADQSSKGVRIPFLGHDCNTSTAPAVLALRYHFPLYTAICYRVGLAKWRIEAGDEIPTHENGAPRSVEAIMRDVNLALEKAVRRDPANWFWVHRRWKN